MNTIQRDIGRLEGKMDLMLDSVTKLTNAFNTLEEGRVSTLERQMANLLGRMSMVVAIASVLTTGLLFAIEHFLLK